MEYDVVHVLGHIFSQEWYGLVILDAQVAVDGNVRIPLSASVESFEMKHFGIACSIAANLVIYNQQTNQKLGRGTFK